MLYVSSWVLQTYTPLPNIRHLKHDVLDDLESHYHIFYTVMIAQMANGNDHLPKGSIFSRWANEDPEVSMSAKQAHFNQPESHRKAHISSSWSPETMTALDTWYQIMQGIQEVKTKVTDLDTDKKIKMLQTEIDKVQNTYAGMMAALNTATEKLTSLKVASLVAADLQELYGNATITRFLPGEHRLFSHMAPTLISGIISGFSSLIRKRDPADVGIGEPGSSRHGGKRVRRTQAAVLTSDSRMGTDAEEGEHNPFI